MANKGKSSLKLDTKKYHRIISFCRTTHPAGPVHAAQTLIGEPNQQLDPRHSKGCLHQYDKNGEAHSDQEQNLQY